MTEALRATPADWSASAAALARAASRRARAEAALTPLAAGLGVGAALALGARVVLHAGPGAVLGALAVGAALGGAVGTFRARRVRPVALADAAWALDRLAGARERGLSAALLPDDVAREAAAAAPGAPPRVRLRAPAGLAALASAGLLAAVAWAVPARAPAAAPEDRGRDGADASRQGSAQAASEREAEAEGLARRGREVAAAREALGLPAHAPLDPERVAERLSSPEAVEAARRAAPETAAAAAASDDPTPSAALARLLADDPASRAESLRREALALRAASLPPDVPAARRDLVGRYFARRAAGGESR